MTTPTYAIAMACMRDAGARSARRNGRTAWTDDDNLEAQRAFVAVYRLTPDFASLPGCEQQRILSTCEA